MANETRKAQKVPEGIRNAVFTPKGFKDEASLVEGIARSCAGKRTALITANYAVKESPDTEEDDPRLLGPQMLLTVELAARVYAKCIQLGIEPPTIVLVPNDIAPGLFQSIEEKRALKASYTVPEEITDIFSAHGLIDDPVYFFNRDFSATMEETKSWAAQIRARLREGKDKLVVIFESFAQNLASTKLGRGKASHTDEIIDGARGEKVLQTPTTLKDTASGEPILSSTLVPITKNGGEICCSFLAATLFREFESLGFAQMVNMFVRPEYPCVDKAAAAFRYMYGGKMSIRNIYLDGEEIVYDSTID